MKKWRRLLAVVLATVLVVGSVPQSVLADDKDYVTTEADDKAADSEETVEVTDSDEALDNVKVTETTEETKTTEESESTEETKATEESESIEETKTTEETESTEETEATEETETTEEETETTEEELESTTEEEVVPQLHPKASEKKDTEGSKRDDSMRLFSDFQLGSAKLEVTEVKEVDEASYDGKSWLDSIWKDKKDTKDENHRLSLYEDDELVTVIVELEDAPVMDYYSTSTYSDRDDDTSAGEAVANFLASDDVKEASEEILASQDDVISQLSTKINAGSSTYSRRSSMNVEVLERWTIVANAFSVKIPYGKLGDIQKLDGVKRAYVQHVYNRPEPVDTAVIPGKPIHTYSYDLVGVDQAWQAGYTGKGMLVSVLDSGIDIKTNWEGKVVRTHEAFTEDSFLSKTADGKFDWELRYDEASITEFVENTLLAANTGSEGNLIIYDNNALYKNIKVPFAADYADGDVNVCPTTSDHGTHVSGTIAGYAKTEEGEIIFSGIAPDAQLLMMKVFPDEEGGAEESSIMNALEDSLKLGADMINLSLGSDNGYAVDDTAQNDTFARIEAAGIVMMTSAGNSAYSTSNNNYGGDNLSSNPDISMMSSPAIYESNLCVASSDNQINVQSYFTWEDSNGKVHEVSFSDPYTVAMKSTYANGEYPIIAVDGVGTYNDYYAAGFDNGYNGGKSGIALVKRGEISFSDKVNNALSFTGTNSRGQRYGVLGVIIYDNDPEGTELINMSVDNVSLTSAFISGKDGKEILDALKEGYQVRIKVAQDDKIVDYETSGQMSSYSSWGAGPGLELKPEITAPGGNIWSTIIDTKNTSATDEYVGSYGMMSGTSMAAPHMTGISAIVRQYVEQNSDKFNVTDKGMADLLSQLLVSTATPIKDTNGVYYSPRQQGAGLVNANAAITTPAYLSMEGQNVAKLELLDDPEKTGKYDIRFDVNNISKGKVTYDVSVVLMCPEVETVETDWGVRNVMKENDAVILEQKLGEVSVPAKSSKEFSATVSLSKEVKAMLDNNFENGSYVEGFVILTDKSNKNPDLGVPVLAFYGDWTKAPILDSSYWYDEPLDGESIYGNENTWGVNFVGSCVRNDYEIINYMDLGFNPYTHDVSYVQGVYHQENFVLSPDGNGYLDQIDDYVIYQLRNARLIVVEVKDRESGEVYFRDWVSYPFKTTFESGYGAAIPYSAYGLFPTWKGTDSDGKVLPNGTKCTFSIYAYGEGDYPDEVYVESEGRNVTNFDEVIPGENEPTFNGHKMDMTGDFTSFELTIDTEAPKLKNNAVSIYEEDGRTYIKGTVYDEHSSLATVELMPIVTRTYKEGYGNPDYSEVGLDRINTFYLNDIYDAGVNEVTFVADVTEYAHTNESYAGENYYYNFEWTGNIMLSCGDYGANGRSYAIKVDSTNGLVLSQTSALLHPGDSFELSVNNNTGKDDTVITRTSSNPEVATIDEYGMITAISAGQAVMTVSDGNSSAKCVVAVEDYNTVVEDFDLSIESFKHLKPGGELVVKVTNLQPADVVITEKSWSVSESDEYAQEYGAGQIRVSKETSDGLSASLWLYYTVHEPKIPAGVGTLTVTLNGVSRSMEIGWEDSYTTKEQDDLVSGVNFNEQDIYTTLGESVTLSASYKNSKLHQVGDVISEVTGLVLDGPDFFTVDGGASKPYKAKLVNLEGYELPEKIKIYNSYNYGDYSYDSEMYLTDTLYSYSYNSYTYNQETGEIVVVAPSGSNSRIKVVAQGVESEGNPAGELSGKTYSKPDNYYGPFDWTVVEGKGSLSTKEITNNYGETYEVAEYEASETGVSIIRATTKDGSYSVDFAVVTNPVMADTLSVDTHKVELKVGEKTTLHTTLDPIPTFDEDTEVVFKSYDPSVATIDENGVITAVSEGYAYIKISSESNNKVMSYCVVQVNKKPEPKPEQKPEPGPEPKPETKPAPKPITRPTPIPVPKPVPEPVPQSQIIPETEIIPESSQVPKDEKPAVSDTKPSTPKQEKTSEAVEEETETEETVIQGSEEQSATQTEEMQSSEAETGKDSEANSEDKKEVEIPDAENALSEELQVEEAGNTRIIVVVAVIGLVAIAGAVYFIIRRKRIINK